MYRPFPAAEWTEFGGKPASGKAVASGAGGKPADGAASIRRLGRHGD